MPDLLVRVSGDTVLQYPYGMADLRAAHPNTCFPDDPAEELLAGYDVYPVERTGRPEYDPEAHRPYETNPVRVDGKWRQHWSLRAATPDEVEAVQAENAAKAEALARAALKGELAGSIPPQSVPGLAERLLKIEKALGLRPL